MSPAYWCDSSCVGVRRYVKFDTFHPAVNKGLPVTRVVSRVELQEILARATERIAGTSIIQNDCHVVDYEERVCGATTGFSILMRGRESSSL